MKCIECGNCNRDDMKCRLKSVDCAKEYDLTEEDLYSDKDCDFARSKDDNSYYYLLLYITFPINKGKCAIRTNINKTDFLTMDKFVIELKRNNVIPSDLKVQKVFEITEKEYKEYNENTQEGF